MNTTANAIHSPAERPWLSAYPPGVPADIDADKFASIIAVFAQSCEKFRHLPAFTCMGKTITYDDLDHQTRALAGYLQGVLKQIGRAHV